MRRHVRLMLFALLVAALPLRGIAAASMLFCGAHEAAPAAAGHAHDAHESHEHHGDAHDGHPGGDAGEGSPAASVCSLCASCCAGAGLVPAPLRVFDTGAPHGEPIPFLARHVADVLPRHPDRPPAAS